MTKVGLVEQSLWNSRDGHQGLCDDCHGCSDVTVTSFSDQCRHTSKRGEIVWRKSMQTWRHKNIQSR